MTILDCLHVKILHYTKYWYNVVCACVCMCSMFPFQPFMQDSRETLACMFIKLFPNNNCNTIIFKRLISIFLLFQRIKLHHRGWQNLKSRQFPIGNNFPWKNIQRNDLHCGQSKGSDNCWSVSLRNLYKSTHCWLIIV